MAVNGQMEFPNGAAANEGIQNVALTIKHIELEWGDDLRVDPLTSELAVVASSRREIQVDAAGHRVQETVFLPDSLSFEMGAGNSAMLTGRYARPHRPPISTYCTKGWLPDSSASVLSAAHEQVVTLQPSGSEK